VALARAVLGEIDLDPASDEDANQIIRAARIYTKADQGLWQSWSGRVFLNPPGGLLDPHTLKQLPPKARVPGVLSSAAVWWCKLVTEFDAGRVSAAVYVSFNLESMLNTQKFCRPIQAFPFCVPRKRLEYPSSNGGHTNAPQGASAIVYIGPDTQKFRSVFSEIGWTT
jgi:hypothetical protein